MHAQRRVMSVAAVQEHLHAFGWSDLIQIGPYLTKLCGTLAASMIGDSRPVSLQVLVDGGTAVSAQAVSYVARLSRFPAVGDYV